jgi:hypothetical protein
MDLARLRPGDRFTLTGEHIPMAKIKQVHINLTSAHGVVYVGEDGERQDLQPADNPHQVDEVFAAELAQRGSAEILDPADAADAVRAKKARAEKATKAAARDEKKE